MRKIKQISSSAQLPCRHVLLYGVLPVFSQCGLVFPYTTLPQRERTHVTTPRRDTRSSP